MTFGAADAAVVVMGAAVAPRQLRLVATAWLAVIINHNYQHAKWISEVRTDTFGLDPPPTPASPWLAVADDYPVITSL